VLFVNTAIAEKVAVEPASNVRLPVMLIEEIVTALIILTLYIF
jgi:hypothetical protein